MSYADAGHRPHAIHTGEEPKNIITYGPDSLDVRLTTWGPQEGIFPVLYDALQSNWGDAPSHTIDDDCRCEENPAHRAWKHDSICCSDCQTGWCRLNEAQREYLDSCFAGRTLPQVLEGLKFHFTIDGVSRAFTHQNVRTRIGAAFMQHGGRDNDWRHRAWTMPETIRRAIEADKTDGNRYEGPDNGCCITDWRPIDKLCEKTPCFTGYESRQVDRDGTVGIDPTLKSVIEHYLAHGREIYAALVDAGIPWQDARRLLWMGTQTYIHDIYDYLAMAGMLSKRLEHVMDWEHNCVAQLMVREIRMKCPPIISKYLMSMSDRQQRAAFAGLESWPPDMKYDPNFPCECGHNRANHLRQDTGEQDICLVCNGRPEGGAGKPLCVRFRPKDPLPRTHRAEQNPFFVLHPDSMNGGPIIWLPTNGVYPEALRSTK